MLNFINTVRLKNQSSQKMIELEIDARQLIENMNINPDQNNQQIINHFEKIIQESKLFEYFQKIDKHFQNSNPDNNTDAVINKILEMTKKIKLEPEKKQLLLSHLSFLNLLVRKLKLN